jgi:hypothetical protein
MKQILLFLSICTIGLFSGEHALRIAEIQEALSETTFLNKQFDLYKELFTLQWEEYRVHQPDISDFVKNAKTAGTFCTYKKSETNAASIEEAFLCFSEEERELFTSYMKLLHLAGDLNHTDLMSNITFSEKNDIPFLYQSTDYHRPYFLEILDLERTINCPILKDLLLKYEIINMQDMLEYFWQKTTVYYIQGYTENHTFKNKGGVFLEVQFYWNSIVPIAEQLLHKLDNEWKDLEYDKRKVLNLLFAKKHSYLMPCPDPNLNFIDRVLPFVVKNSHLSLITSRFDTIYEHHEAWKKKYDWFKLHVQAYEILKSTDRAAAEKYLKEAEVLCRTSLNTPIFSNKKKEWQAARASALELLSSCK